MEGNKIHINDCFGCKYYYGTIGGDYKNASLNSSKVYPMCSYYADTGKHRFDDFGTVRKHNEWLGICNRYEAKVQPREKAELPTFTKNGVKCLEEKRKKEEHEKKLREILEMKFTGICDCPMCGSDKIGTSDSRDINGNRIRRKVCKKCGYSFKTVEIMLEDLSVFSDQEDDGK